MSRKQDRAINDPFARLNKNLQTLIMLDFEGNHSNKEIAPLIGLKNETTVSHWRKKLWYEPAFNAYAVRAIKGTLIDLLDAKSEMVRFQAATAVLKMSGLLSDNSTPELDKAKIRKADAEADMAELKVSALKNGDNDDGVTINFIRTKRKEEEDHGEAT